MQDLRFRGHWFETYWSHCVVSFSKTVYPVLSAGSTQEMFQHDFFSTTVCRVPTGSGNHGKPGKSRTKVQCMEKSWNLKKNPE